MSDDYSQDENTLEAERRHLAARLQGSIIEPLNLLLAQALVYEQTLAANPQARMAVSVLASLARGLLQNVRDLETDLHPAILESLGLEAALESLANQHRRMNAAQVAVMTRVNCRLSPAMELAIFRAVQEGLDRASRSRASHIHIRLENDYDYFTCSLLDNGLPLDETLSSSQQRIEALGGTLSAQAGERGGFEVVIRFPMKATVELTVRESEVLALLAEGLSNKEIATALGISARTINFHLDNLYDKLGVGSRTEAVVYALREGWLNKQGKTD